MAVRRVPPKDPPKPDRMALHNFVAERATKYIKRLHTCLIGAMNFTGGWSREIVDGIVFNNYGSFLIEAKASRSDFLADAKKSFRINPETGIGKYRFYACPEGLISPDELPEKWGLIYVNDKGHCTMLKGYGKLVKIGEEKLEEYYFKTPVYKLHGCPDKYGDPDRAKIKYAFDYDVKKENTYLLYLAKRYKEGRFMDNIL